MGSLFPGVAQEGVTPGTILLPGALQAPSESLSPSPPGAAVPKASGCPRFSSTLLPSLPTPFLAGIPPATGFGPREERGDSQVRPARLGLCPNPLAGRRLLRAAAPSISGDPGAAPEGAPGGCRGERRKTDRIKITELAGPGEGRPAR